MEWRPITEIEEGDYVAAPVFDDISRTKVPVRDFIELETEKIQLSDQTVAFLREELIDRFGSLRAAAKELELSEDFIYLHLKNRHVPLSKLRRILAAIDRSIDDVEFDRFMVRHGHSITIPTAFDGDLLYLIGLVYGDGDIRLDRRGGNRGMIRLSNGNEEILRRAIEIFESKFDMRPEIEHQHDRVPCIRVHNTTIARLFRNIGMRSPKHVISLAPNLTTAKDAHAFLRGLMDADGSVSIREDGGSSVLFSTISEQLARQVQLMLETYNVQGRLRERDRRGKYELEDGHVIESKAVQFFVEIYGSDIDRYAEEIGFECHEKAEALEQIKGEPRRKTDRLPIASTISSVNGPTGRFASNIRHGQQPSRDRARTMLTEIDLGDASDTVSEMVEASIRWEQIVSARDTGLREVFDLTVPGTHNFIGNGIVTHNTAAAVRDDFGDGQQWSLEAGALVLADQGIAAVDELDKMDPGDRSAMHEGLEAQEISISKAGINATLKARCSLLGAANPQYGRFDPYEPMGEQIDLEPALISRFDLIFTMTDQPDEEQDRNLAEHILETNYAGELSTQLEKLNAPDVDQAELDAASGTVTPAIEPDLFRKYVAFAQQSCYPRMTDEARAAIQEFYVDLRSRGTDEDAPVPVTARKLEALVRLSEASARVRLSDTVGLEDAERVIELVRSCLQDIGVDPETGQYDADVIETGRSKTQRDRVRNIKEIIRELQGEHEDGAPVEEVLARASEVGIERSKAEHQIQKLKDSGEVFTPQSDVLRLV